MSWNATDDESGIQVCEWAIGEYYDLIIRLHIIASRRAFKLNITQSISVIDMVDTI